MPPDPVPARAPAKGALIAFRSDRLGARLVSLMNAMRLAEDLGVEFRCAWNESLGVGQTFNDPTELFKAGFVKRHFLSAEEWSAARPKAETLTGQLQQQPERVAEILAAGQDLIVGNAFGVITLKGEDADAVTARFRAQFARIPFAPPVAVAMADLDRCLAGHTAYHIRRGDLTDDPKAKHKPWPHKVVPNEFYERHMAAALDGPGGSSGAILFSDDADSIAHYRALFPQLKCLTDVVSTDGLTEAQRDLLELYAMSRCGKIIAPERSAFSSTAADLTGAAKASVAQAMDEPQRHAAHEALYERLRDRPESFAGDGHVGQALAHIGDWLEKEGRLRDAAALFAARIRDGLGISFVYPQAMRLQHLIDAPEQVVETARHMAARPAVYVKDQATAEVLHGYAHLRLGDRTRGFAHIVNGFWHGPGVATGRMVVPVLVEAGLLTPQNFLPVSPVQLGLQRRRGPLRLLFEEFGALAGMCGQIPTAVGAVDTAVWDWAPLMRSVSFQALRRQGAIAKQAELLAALAEADDDPAERDSLAAILAAFDGRSDEAVARLIELTHRDDATAMTWQRLSHAHWLARRFRKAKGAAMEAAARAPDWPILGIWLGMTALRVRKYEEAEAILTGTDLPGLPSLFHLRAQVLQRAGRLDEALAAIEQATALAPLQVDCAMLAAKLHVEAGAPDRGIPHLMRIVDAQRAPGKLFVQLIDLLQTTGDMPGAREMTALALERAPSHGPLAEIAEADAAAEG